MRQLAVGAVHLSPLVVQRHDLGHLVVQQAVNGGAARRAVGQLAVRPAGGPPMDPQLVQLQLPTCPSQAPPSVEGVVDEVQQRRLGGLVHAAWDSATQPQAPFPSTNMSFTAISLSASPKRAASARAASSS